MREEAFDASTGVRRITDFFGSAETRTAAALGTVLALPPPVQTCLAALVDHLRAFNLERILCLTSNFQPFSTQGRNCYPVRKSTAGVLCVLTMEESSTRD